MEVERETEQERDGGEGATSRVSGEDEEDEEVGTDADWLCRESDGWGGGGGEEGGDDGGILAEPSEVEGALEEEEVSPAEVVGPLTPFSSSVPSLCLSSGEAEFFSLTAEGFSCTAGLGSAAGASWAGPPAAGDWLFSCE